MLTANRLGLAVLFACLFIELYTHFSYRKYINYRFMNTLYII